MEMPRLGKRGWDHAIEGFYNKYGDFTQWHIGLVKQVVNNQGLLALPEGPHFHFQKVKKGDYNRAQIYNYPIQGFSSEILNLVLCQVSRSLRGLQARIINTVHDSIIVDAPKEEVDRIIEAWQNIYDKLSENVSRFFHIHVNVPLAGELSIGPNWMSMEKVK